MEEQQKCSKKNVWNVRILHLKLSTHKENRTSVLFVFLFYKENTQKPFRPKSSPAFHNLKVYSIEVTLMMYYLSAEPLCSPLELANKLLHW